MAQIKKEDLNSLTTEDLKQRLHDDADRLQKLRFNHAVNPLENPLQLRYLRKEVARLKTELRKRELTAK
ncbi:MAG: 50S ribosomal protein L29 [Bacteroidetes bacterium]|nr:50S ribosomal protein L29 [Bacteroidota bacterium]MBP7398832.1 50S ribosomal protein L29 [Chitinophagales bacterium]MBK7107834.1 50S ribosomal protein L29 [Bacteroidota bacterium]MBK8486729.1 50S ribosomal protein L29 [Bacteroidota bacterium]MBK8681367.1 50S ribosomal protein L29 [Bacteroidota bacterium]